MPLMDELGIDQNVVLANEVEDAMKAGPLPAEGLHHAVLEGFREGTANTGRKFRELTFKIIGGPSKGAEVKESLWNSDDQKGKNRVILFAHRLGLLGKKDNKYVAIPGKDDFNACLGAECVIDVKHREYEKKTGGKGVGTELSFEGVLSVDDPRCKDVPKGKVTAGGGGVTPKPLAKDTYDDI